MSTLKVDTLDTRTGSGNITFSRPTTLTAGDIVTADIAADAIDGTKIADNAVDSEHYTDASIDEAHIANDAVNFITHLKAGTDGELITWDASGNPAAVSVGTATHVLTSGGAGVAPTFAAPGASGMQVQEDYFSMNMSRATGTTVVTLNTDFTATPQVMWMTYNNNYGAGGFVTAWMNVEGDTAGTQNPGNSTYGQGNSYLQCNTGAGRQNIEFTASTSGASSAATYTITNTKVSGPVGTGYFTVLVFG